MKPKEFYALTHKDYNLMCEGFFDSEVKSQKKMRMLGWWIVSGYADPKSMPASPEKWWPLDGDPVQVVPKVSKARRKKIENLIADQLAKLNKK